MTFAPCANSLNNKSGGLEMLELNLSLSEAEALKKQVWDLRVNQSQYTHSDDKRRMVDAADSIARLLAVVSELRK